MFIKQDNFLDAEAKLVLAESLTPNDPNLHVTFAQMLNKEGNYQEALDHAQKATEVDQFKTLAYTEKARALFYQENFSEAIIAANKGLEVIDQDVSLLQANKPAERKKLYYTLANIYFNTGDKEKETMNKELGDQAVTKLN
jgi:tetratricopeptide (TPR) repeat protein